MAKGEHQGLQIALILFVMVAVVLAITTFVFYRQADEQLKVAEAAKKAKDDATTRANESDAKLEFIMAILGAAPLPEATFDALKSSVSNDDKMKTVIANYNDHMSVYAAGLTKEEQNYASILPKMLFQMRQINVSTLGQLAEANKYKNERDDIQKSEKERTEIAVQKQGDAEKKLDEEITKYNDDRKKLEAQQQGEATTYASALKQKDDRLAKATEKDDKNQKELKKTQQVIDSQLKAIKEMREEPFEVADGQVAWVNQGASTVWINLGLADGLRRQTMFSVYDQADNGVKRTERKAAVEVTRVLDQHLAEARIVDDSPGNPILPGDQIFSPAWRPGKRVRFALAGFLDIDGDGRSDRNLVRSLLLASGGQIDAEMHDDGTIEGTPTSSTRYLVVGESPTRTAVADPKALAGWSKMIGDCQQLGIESIPLEKMLEWVGYRAEVRTIGLGKNADALQFKPRAPEGKSPTSTSSKAEYKEKGPADKSGKAGSAFK